MIEPIIEIEDDIGIHCINLTNIEYFWSYFSRELLDDWYCISIRFKSNLNGIQFKYSNEENRNKVYNYLKKKFSEFITSTTIKG